MVDKTGPLLITLLIKNYKQIYQIVTSTFLIKSHFINNRVFIKSYNADIMSF